MCAICKMSNIWVFVKALFIIAKLWKQLKCQSTDKLTWKIRIMEYIYWNTYSGILFSFKIEENLTICDNMDELGGHSAQWNKPGIDKQMLYDSTSMQDLK